MCAIRLFDLAQYGETFNVRSALAINYDLMSYDRMAYLLRTLQQDVGAVNVVLGELEGVSEGIVYVRLRCEVEDGVDLLLAKDVRDQV